MAGIVPAGLVGRRTWTGFAPVRPVAIDRRTNELLDQARELDRRWRIFGPRPSR